ncbi:MAG: YceI family protein [Abitibacteriaceae bacterium]|nr:YceI family protein [Abditibacteriaceae bacterium]
MTKCKRSWRGQFVGTALIIGCGLVAPEAAKLAQAAPTAISYKIVPGQSKFDISSHVSGIASHTRTMVTNSVNGVVGFTKTMQPTTVQLTVPAGSLQSNDGPSVERNQITKVTKAQIVEAGKYPNIVFKSTGFSPSSPVKGSFNGVVKGNLTLHGVTKPIAVPVRATVSGNTLHASGKITINQTTYGITLLSLMMGAVKVDNPVTLSFNIVAKK